MFFEILVPFFWLAIVVFSLVSRYVVICLVCCAMMNHLSFAMRLSLALRCAVVIRLSVGLRFSFTFRSATLFCWADLIISLLMSDFFLPRLLIHIADLIILLLLIIFFLPRLLICISELIPCCWWLLFSVVIVDSHCWFDHFVADDSFLSRLLIRIAILIRLSIPCSDISRSQWSLCPIGLRKYAINRITAVDQYIGQLAATVCQPQTTTYLKHILLGLHSTFYVRILVWWSYDFIKPIQPWRSRPIQSETAHDNLLSKPRP